MVSKLHFERRKTFCSSELQSCLSLRTSTLHKSKSASSLVQDEFLIPDLHRDDYNCNCSYSSNNNDSYDSYSGYYDHDDVDNEENEDEDEDNEDIHNRHKNK
eukprot:Pgem_evm1s1885